MNISVNINREPKIVLFDVNAVCIHGDDDEGQNIRVFSADGRAVILGVDDAKKVMRCVELGAKNGDNAVCVDCQYMFSQYWLPEDFSISQTTPKGNRK